MKVKRYKLYDNDFVKASKDFEELDCKKLKCVNECTECFAKWLVEDLEISTRIDSFRTKEDIDKDFIEWDAKTIDGTAFKYKEHICEMIEMEKNDERN